VDVLKSAFDEMVAKLKKQHPDWSDDRCRRVAASIGRKKYGAKAMAQGAAAGKPAASFSKATSSKGTDVPEREHPTSDHHMSYDQALTPYCPHCGEALDLTDRQTEQGAPRRKRRSRAPEYDATATHKCLGSSIANLRKVMA